MAMQGTHRLPQRRNRLARSASRRAEAAELAVQAEKDGTARLNAVISGAQERMREAKQQAENQAAAFETDLNSKTAAQCRALEQAAASRSGAAAAMIVERIWDSEWQS